MNESLCIGELLVLLHHHCSPSPYPDPCAIHSEVLLHLHDLDLLRLDDSGIERTTDRGVAYVAMIEALPDPRAH